MRKEENINVRLDPNLKKRVDATAASLGTTPSMILRLLLERFVDHAEASDGKVVMPPEFKVYKISDNNETDSKKTR